MKTRIFSLILALAVLLSSLAACESTDTPSTSGGNISGKPAQSSVQNAEGSEEVNETETEPDYSGFEMPEATGELIVYGMSGNDLAITAAVDLFREEYPDVHVKFEMMSSEEFQTRIQTEIPAGHGPDLLFTFTSVIPDPFKSMSAHIFTDLNPYFLNDAEFSFDDYLKEAMDCLLFQGERQIVPVEVNLPVYKTTLETLADAEITPENIKTFEDYSAACIRYHDAYPENALFSSGGDDDYLTELLKASGIQFIDYSKGTVSVSETQFHALMDVCKTFHNGTDHEIDPDHKSVDGLFERMYLCSNVGTGELSLMNSLARIRNHGETPYLLPVIDASGGVTAEVVSFAAVPQGSANKLNAYRLLKILLSEEIQEGHEPSGRQRDYLQVGIPVLKAASTKRTQAVKEMFFPDSDEDAQLIIDYCTSITRASLLPKVLYRYIVNDMSAYIEGKKTWEDCYKKFMNTLELYASE
ncbi:MAG: carbohydrate ABC transporter substrate-binding protein [Oscillospiraceae bacterium]|nr:carbohydrate ABC transporter substrate-binding protein [Oscillospiraceae bacterium]MBR4895250.1 carbohydrate ABC transporter substrate-binding protein [Clostridia bacterium]